jgi:transcriptional regulator with XRE-family HTH domain
LEFFVKIKEVREELQLNQKEFAEKLHVSPAAISRYEKNERKPDSNFLYSMINILGVDPMWLFLDRKPMLSQFNLFSQAYSLAEKNDKKDDLKNLLLGFVEDQSTFQTIVSKIEKMKGQTFFQKLSLLWDGTSTRKLRVLYYFLKYIKETNIQISQNLKVDFIEKLQAFNLPKTAKLKFFNDDKDALVEWARNELDDASIFEILTSIDSLIKETQYQMNWFDLFVTKIDF